MRGLCDLGDLACAMHGHARGAELRNAARTLDATLRRMVVARSLVRPGEVTEGCTDEARVGLTVFLPSPLTEDLTGYTRECGLARRTGYAGLVGAYLAHTRALLPGLALP